MSDDPVVTELLEEAEEDLQDAQDLGRRAGSASMALYQAAQGAEKFLRALLQVRGRPAPLNWDLGKVFGATRDLADLADLASLAEPVGRLAGHATPGRTGVPPETIAEGLRTLLHIRYQVRKALGDDLPAPPEEVPAAPPASATPREAGPEPVPAAPSEGPGEGRRRGPPGPGSYVRQVWLCERCGVRLPRTRQTGRGATCPHCNRPMRLVPGN